MSSKKSTGSLLISDDESDDDAFKSGQGDSNSFIPLKDSLLFDDTDSEEDTSECKKKHASAKRGKNESRRASTNKCQEDGEKAAKTSSKSKGGGGGGWQDKTPLQKYRAFQAYRNFLSREPPKALGSKEIPQGQENCLEGLTFVITGVFESIDREETKSLILKHGGKVTNSVTRMTKYLVAGRDCGQSKLDKAAEFGTEMLDEDGLFDLIHRLPGKKSKYQIAAENERFQHGKPSGKQHWSVNKKKNSRSSWSADDSVKFGDKQTSSDAESAAQSSDSSLWVDNYKPTNIRQIIGQQGDKSSARKLYIWLSNWRDNFWKKPVLKLRANDDGAGHKAVLLSGPPGIGKTTTAQIVCQELGFSYIELNASDMRSKRKLNEALGAAVSSRTLSDFFGNRASHKDPEDSWKHCLIMDEVDGMAGNEDRGGIQELIQLIKRTQIPVICICNEKGHSKIRSLSNYCFDLRFQRPRVEQIKAAMMSMAYKEGLTFPPAALNKVIVAANQDIRQVIHNLSMWTAVEKNLTYDQLWAAADNAKKDLHVDTFDICRKTFASGDEMMRMTLSDKIDLFFHDYSLVPLFAYENYIGAIPYSSRGSIQEHLDCVVSAMDSISYGDLVDMMVRRGQNWNLLPTQAVFANVVPGDVMRGAMGQMIMFPAWLGKHSTMMKNIRLLQELCSHMHLNISSGRNSLVLDYLPYLRTVLSEPLINEGADGVNDVVARMHAYDLLRDDFDNIMDLASYSDCENLRELIDSKVKGTFTRTYNKSSCPLPYATASMSKKKRKRQNAAEDEGAIDVNDDGGFAAADSSEQSDDDDIAADSMIKQKKKQKTLAKIKQLTEEEDSTRVVKQKGKSKGKSQKGNQTKGGKDVPAKKSRSKKSAKQSEVTTKCNILPYFTVKK